MAMCLHADVNDDTSDDSLDIGRGDLGAGEADDGPASQERFEVFLGVGDEARAAAL
jgi:hypothetical protein